MSSDPVCGVIEWCCDEPEAMNAAMNCSFDETRVLENAEMFRRRRLGDVERGPELPRRTRPPLGDEREHGAPGWIAECSKRLVQAACVIYSHMAIDASPSARSQAPDTRRRMDMQIKSDDDLRGGCLCGAVRFTAEAAPLMMASCHCRDCQKATGAAYFPAIAVPAASLRVLRG